MGWPEAIVEAVGLRKRLLDTAARVNHSVDSAAPLLSRDRRWCINIPSLLVEAVGGWLAGSSTGHALLGQ